MFRRCCVAKDYYLTPNEFNPFADINTLNNNFSPMFYCFVD
jgi:hypothetical protein